MQSNRPLDRTRVPLDRTSIPLDRTSISLDRIFLPLDRTSIPLDRIFLPFDRTSIPLDRVFLPSDRTFLPFDRTSIILSLAILHWFIPLWHFTFNRTSVETAFHRIVISFGRSHHLVSGEARKAKPRSHVRVETYDL